MCTDAQLEKEEDLKKVLLGEQDGEKGSHVLASDQDGEKCGDEVLHRDEGGEKGGEVKDRLTQLRDLCQQVWPALAVIGGVDRGLRVGGQCMHKLTSRKGTLLGVLKPSAVNAKIQWDDCDATIK